MRNLMTWKKSTIYGWCLPQAHIVVRYKEWKSFSFAPAGISLRDQRTVWHSSKCQQISGRQHAQLSAVVQLKSHNFTTFFAAALPTILKMSWTNSRLFFSIWKSLPRLSLLCVWCFRLRSRQIYTINSSKKVVQLLTGDCTQKRRTHENGKNWNQLTFVGEFPEIFLNFSQFWERWKPHNEVLVVSKNLCCNFTHNSSNYPKSLMNRHETINQIECVRLWQTTTTATRIMMKIPREMFSIKCWGKLQTFLKYRKIITFSFCEIFPCPFFTQLLHTAPMLFCEAAKAVCYFPILPTLFNYVDIKMLFISVVGRCRCHPESTMMTMWRQAIFSFSLHRLLNEHRTKGMMVEIGREFAVISLHSRESFSGGNNNRCEVVESKEKREKKFATLFQVEDLSNCL